MIIEKFSPAELRQLKKLLEPYGAIRACAEATGIHRSTIARILRTGEATSIIVARLRDYVEQVKS